MNISEYNQQLTKKFFDPETKDALQNVTLSDGRKIEIRNDRGLNYTFDRLSTALSNLAASGAHQTALAAFSSKRTSAASAVRKFSAGNGNVFNYGGATNSLQNGVMSTDVVDISLASTIFGLWPWFCMERNMETPSANFTYSQLIAKNQTSGFNVGDPVISPITAPPLNLLAGDHVDISADVTLTGSNDKLSLGGPVMPGSVVGYLASAVQDGKEEIVDRSNGQLFGKGIVGTIDYKTGEIKFNNGLNTTYSAELTFKAISDRSHEASGAHVIKMQNEWVTAPLAAVTTQLILQGNVFDNINYNKMIHRVNQVSGGYVNTITDPYQMAMEQLTQADMSNKNNMAIAALVECTKYAPQMVLDWSSLTLTGYASTYQMFTKMQILKVRGEMAARTGKDVTCWMVDMKGAYCISVLEGFVSNGNEASTGRDGLIGTLDGIPVVRAAGLNDKSRVAEATAINNSSWSDKVPGNYGLIIGVHKDPSGILAPCVFGEYLPPFMTSLAGNYDQPLMMANNLFSSIAVGPVVPQLVCSIALKPFPTNTLEVAMANPVK